jgi:hypothetical protein
VPLRVVDSMDGGFVFGPKGNDQGDAVQDVFPTMPGCKVFCLIATNT